MSELHSAIVSLVALAANIAANHPKQGLCQVERLRDMGVPEAHIRTVVDIARHIRDEAAQTLDSRFDEALAALLDTPSAASTTQPADKPRVPKGKTLGIAVTQAGACCTPTPSGQSCC